MTYWRNVGSIGTRFLNALAGGNVWGESTSSAVGRKSLEGRLAFRIWGFAIDLMFLIATKGQQRRHCIENIDWHLLPQEVRERTMHWKGGAEADAMRERVMAVKVAIPKPASERGSNDGDA